LELSIKGDDLFRSFAYLHEFQFDSGGVTELGTVQLCHDGFDLIKDKDIDVTRRKAAQAVNLDNMNHANTRCDLSNCVPIVFDD